MTYSAWIDEDDYDAAPAAAAPRLRPILKAGVIVGFGVVAAAVMMVAVGGARGVSSPDADLSASAPALVDPPAPIRVSRSHALGEVEAIPSSGTVADGRDWMFAPSVPGEPTAFRGARPMMAAVDPTPEPTVQDIRVMPMPSANPLFASRGVGNEPADKAQLRELSQQLVAPPLPTRNPLMAGRRQLAELEPADRATPAPENRAPAAATPPVPADAAKSLLPGPGDKFALYDIKGRVVYMPNGEKLEAHSGYGDMFDDPRYVHKRMVGPTPPNIYELKMREALFHGVEAIRMKPVGDQPMYGRDGILAHTYMLGPRGDSNGCVSFRDYEKFLAAFKRGEVTRMVVVTSLPTKPEPNNPIVAFFAKMAER